MVVFLHSNAQTADFQWGNGFYFNLNIGETVTFNEVDVTLLRIENHFNLIKIGQDSLWFEVARRSLSQNINGMRIFVADNKEVKALANDTLKHGLLKGDALICLSDIQKPLLDPLQFVFPVSFNDGYVWDAEEDSYMFSLYKQEGTGEPVFYKNYEGIGFNMNGNNENQKHWLVALENSRVVWIAKNTQNNAGACVLLESESQPGVFYVYNHLDETSLTVKEGQEIIAGEVIGKVSLTATDWPHLQFAVINPPTEPSFQECFHYLVNGFPQIFGLYFKQIGTVARTYSRGRIVVGWPRSVTGNKKNTQAYEIYSGKGWLLGRWNVAGKVESVTKNDEGNARLKKVLFENTPAESVNPDDYFEYQISVRNGTYRIRVKVGDQYLPTWQKISFEGTTPVTKSLPAGELGWTGEQVVEVQDGTLNIRIYTSQNQVAGLSEIVFQRAF